MRRVITNERQRQYALETRHEKRLSKLGTSTNGTSPTPSRSTHQNRRSRTSLDTYDELDPQLTEAQPGSGSPSVPPENGLSQDGIKSVTDIRYHINILRDGCRIRPKAILTAVSCPGFPSLIQHIHGTLNDRNDRLKSIKVLGPNGLVGVYNEESWKQAIVLIKGNEWMDGEVKCVAYIEEQP